MIIQWQYDSFQRDDHHEISTARERYCRKRKTKLMADSFAESRTYILFFFFFSSSFYLLIPLRVSFIACHDTVRNAFNLWVDRSRRSREIRRLPFPSGETGGTTRLTEIYWNSRWNVSDILDSSRLASLSWCCSSRRSPDRSWSLLSCLRRKG